MAELNVLYKPNGKKVEVAESSLQAAKDLGWTKKDPKVKKETAAQKKKREEAEALAAEESNEEESEDESNED